MTETASDPRKSVRLAGRTALVTGASDKGIGGAVAERLAEEGAHVELWSRTEPQRLGRRFERRGLSAHWTACDVSCRESVGRALAQLAERHERLDVLVNNAGVDVARRREDLAEEDWLRVLDVNLAGVMRVTQAALPRLTAPGGVIINVSSALSLGGCAGYAAYAASKGGLNSFTQALAWELCERRIRVVAVAPGLVHTPMVHKHIAHLSAPVMRQIEACHPLGIGSPHDVAAVIAFLASDDARWITGVTLPVGWAPHYPLPVAALLGDRSCT